MAGRCVQFPQAPQDAPPNADRGDRQDAQQQADGQDVPRGDGNAQPVLVRLMDRIFQRQMFRHRRPNNLDLCKMLMRNVENSR